MENKKNILKFSLIVITICALYGGLFYSLASIVPQIQQDIEEMVRENDKIGGLK